MDPQGYAHKIMRMVEKRKERVKKDRNSVDDMEKAIKRTAIFEEYKDGRRCDVEFSSNISQEDQALINRQFYLIKHVIDNYLLDA